MKKLNMAPLLWMCLTTCFITILIFPISTIASMKELTPEEEKMFKEMLSIPGQSHAEATDTIETQSGPISGVKLKSGDDFVNVYYGIPFAKPPLGELRFQPPKKAERWSSTLKANTPSPSCYQQLPTKLEFPVQFKDLVQRPWTEDCLILNIWTPNPKPEKARVIFFIHGGGFILGSSTWFTDGTLLTQEGVILVSGNYRLGVFGFLNLGHEQAPGNVGLMDQNLALQWVRDNIEAFGGDPESITLMGLSAGSASVGYHLLSPMSKGLFKRAILMSGVPTNIWANREPEKSLEIANKLLNDIGCPKGNTTLSLECLRKKHPEDILTACETESIFSPDVFLPTVDGEFIIEHPSISIISGKFNPGEVLIGTTRDEGSMFLTFASPKLLNTQDGRLHRKDFLQDIKIFNEHLSELQVEALNVLYTDWSNPDDPIMLRDAAKDLYGDSLMVCHTNEFADSIARTGSSVYRYSYGYESAMLSMFFPSWMGVQHGSDQMPVLAPAQFFQHIGEPEKTIFNKFRNHIINFAKHGDPNLGNEEFPGEPHWPQYNHGKQYQLFAGTSSIKKNLRTRECAAWLNFLPLLDGKNHC